MERDTVETEQLVKSFNYISFFVIFFCQKDKTRSLTRYSLDSISYQLRCFNKIFV